MWILLCWVFMNDHFVMHSAEKTLLLLRTKRFKPILVGGFSIPPQSEETSLYDNDTCNYAGSFGGGILC